MCALSQSGVEVAHPPWERGWGFDDVFSGVEDMVLIGAQDLCLIMRTVPWRRTYETLTTPDRNDHLGSPVPVV